MKKIIMLLTVALLGIFTTLTRAQFNSFPPGTFGNSAALAPISGGGGYTGPGDVVGSATTFYGFRGYNVAFSGNVADICDAATGAVCGTATWAGSTLTVPTISGLTCGVGINCVVKKLYDQTGNGNDISQATLSKMPAFTPTALNGKPCATFASASSQVLAGGSISVSQPYTISTVAKRTGNTGVYTGVMTGSGGPGLLGNPTTNTWSVYGGSGGPPTFTVSDNTAHAVQGVFNGSSSIGYVDQTASTLNTPAGTFSSVFNVGFQNNGYWAGDICEVGFWPVGFTGTTSGNSLNTGNMNTNQHNYWGVT